MEKAWCRCRGGGADNKKITFIFQNEPFLLLTGYLEFHFRSQGNSGKSQGIPSWKKSGNPVEKCWSLWNHDSFMLQCYILFVCIDAIFPAPTISSLSHLVQVLLHTGT